MDRHRFRTHGFAALACVGTLAAGTPAHAASGGASADAPAPAPEPATSAPAGPAGPLAEPVAPGTTTCRTQCTALDGARTGSVVRVSGEGLQSVTGLLFTGAPGPDDDTGAQISAATPAAAEAIVPPGAVSGPVVLVAANGRRSKAAARPLRIGAPERSSVEAALASRKVFFGARRDATLDVFVPAGMPQDVSVDVVRLSDGSPIARLEAGTVAPASVTSVAWRGVAGGRVQRDGRYGLRLTGQPATEPFTFLRHRFPIRGKHDYGQGAARFGAGRGGGSHGGEDVFAACGTPLVAARGGTVKFAGFQSRAGNYIVIDGEGTGSDYAYMHLKDRVRFVKGDTVATGQPIGEVGDTGSANGCHLHFELWSAPGWYTGGKPVDPLPQLQEWDTQSGVQTPAATRRAVAARAASSR